jgi:hypothetical protein
MDIRATIREARGAVGQPGWVWTCYSHPDYLRQRFFPNWPLVRLLWKITRRHELAGGPSARDVAERQCRHDLHAHLTTEHADALEET